MHRVGLRKEGFIPPLTLRLGFIVEGKVRLQEPRTARDIMWELRKQREMKAAVQFTFSFPPFHPHPALDGVAHI